MTPSDLHFINARVPFPFTLEWRVTDACNLRCSYCSEYKPVLGKADYGKAVEKIVRLGPKHIWLGGGEPSLVDELPLIAEKLKRKLNPHMAISTNLTRPEIIKKMLLWIDDLIISLDTADRKSSIEQRGVLPSEIISNIKEISREAGRVHKKLNITVSSVVTRDNIYNKGVENLCNILWGINKEIFHMLSPVYPPGSEGSLINDRVGSDKLFQVIEKLKKRGRKIKVDYPGFLKGESSGPVNCFRRYFRVQLVEDGDFFSPCPPSRPSDGRCDLPCNCAAFIDEMLYCDDAQKIKHSPLAGRLSRREADQLASFIDKYKKNRFTKEVKRILSY